TAWHLRAYASAAGFGSGAWRCAAEVLRMLRSRGLRQDHLCCSAVLDACSRSDWRQTVTCLWRMQETCVQQSCASFTAAISCCQSWPIACRAFGHMARIHLEADALSFGSTVSVPELQSAACPNLLGFWPAPGGERKDTCRARLAQVGTNLGELEELLEGAATSAGGTVREVVACIASEGADAWRPRRMLLSDAGFSLQSNSGNQGYFAERGTELMPWSEVSRVLLCDPSTSSASKTTNGRPSYNLYEAELELARPPGRLRLQFGAAGPAQVLQQLWQASQGPRAASGGRPVPLPGSEPLLEEMRANSGSPPCPTRSVFSANLPAGFTVAKVRQLLAGNGPNNPILRLHARAGVQNMEERDWEPLGRGQMKCLHFVLPLKPQPMAPEKTRVTVVYFLCPEQDRVVLQKVTRALDIPYANSFRVYHEHTFTEDAEDKQVVLDLALGIGWIDRCFVKQIIESSTRRETVESGQDLVEALTESLVAC
ncbi:unnamed protein product, partial [Effrenium voratum]